jgi:aromatic-L-amino-acid/L-tryptophan decarboxylase
VRASRPSRPTRRFEWTPTLCGRPCASDIEAGVRPVAVVATLGTTSTSSIDPVASIADVAEEFGLWLHVDAAYGGPAAIVPELRPLFDGWERADSVVVNPHKWLFTPVDCSLLYSRRPQDIVRAFSIVPEYLRSSNVDDVRNLMDYGVALGRRFRSLKLWFVMRYFGREGVVERLRAHVALARDFAGWVEAADGWETVAPVPLSTVAFRHVDAALDGPANDAAEPPHHGAGERERRRVHHAHGAPGPRGSPLLRGEPPNPDGACRAALGPTPGRRARRSGRGGLSAGLSPAP